MTFLLLISLFGIMISGFIVIIDMFKSHFGFGCLGFIFFPILPFIWVLTKYSGNKKIMAPILFGFLVLMLVSWVPISMKASNTIDPFIESAIEEGVPLKYYGWQMTGGKTKFRLYSDKVFEPSSDYKNVEEMLSLLYHEEISKLEKYFNDPLNDENEVVIALKTKSGFYAVYVIESPGVLKESSVTGANPYDD